jgi:meso-butanediol dehydrogenase/(S,S)-butanediol dehydrogenase/diacetyl reductase
MRLKDKVAVVTGGGGGIGEGICLRLAEEGADVMVSDINQDTAEKVAQKIGDIGRRALAVKTDVSKPDQCRSLVNDTLKEMGRLDILVCCAGIMGFAYRKGKTLSIAIEDIPEEDWDQTLDINLKGVFLCNQAIIPHFKEQNSGKIVNVASIAGRQGVTFLAPYAASKAGVISLTQSMAQYLAPFNINVNAICPGIIWTPMWEEGVQVLSQDGPDAIRREIFENIVQSQIAFKRVQYPEDMGNAVVFLVSDEAREITGQALNVCGGMRFN